MGALRGKACLKGQGEAMRRNTGLHWICPRGSRGNLCQKRVSGAEKVNGREGRGGRWLSKEGGKGEQWRGGKPTVEMCVCTRAHTCLRVSGFKWKTHEKMNICHVHVTSDPTHQLPSQTSSSCFPHCTIVLPVSRLGSMDLSLTSSKLLPSLLFGFFVIIYHPFPSLSPAIVLIQVLTISHQISCKGLL